MDRTCEKRYQINVRPVIALFRAAIHLSLVQSVLESFLLLNMKHQIYCYNHQDFGDMIFGLSAIFVIEKNK